MGGVGRGVRQWIKPRSLLLHLVFLAIAFGCLTAGWWRALRPIQALLDRKEIRRSRHLPPELSAAILFHAWRIVRGLKGSPWFPLGFMIFLYAFLLFLPMTFTSMTPYQDFVLNAYVWLLLGVLFRLPKLALSAQYSASLKVADAANTWTP